LALFLKTAAPESVEPTLTIASGLSTVDGYLEFNGPVGSGTVGGAFFNMDGRLLGLALGSVTTDGSSNRVFVLPSSRIEPIVTRLKCCGDRQAGYLGVQVVNTQIRGLQPELKRMRGANNVAGHSPNSYASQSASSQMRFAAHGYISDAPTGAAEITKGALITVVEENSPAQKAGIKVGDVVFQYDNQPVDNADAFRDYVQGCAPDSVISLTFLRGSRQMVVHARLTRAPLQIITGAAKNLSESRDSLPIDQNSFNALLNRIHQLEKRLQALEERR